MPYMLVKENGKECVYKHDANHMPVGNSHGCHDTHEQALAQMRALYAAESKAYDILAKAFDALAPSLSPDELEALTGTFSLRPYEPDAVVEKAEVYGGVKRSDLKDSDFVFPDTRSFPIKTAKDVEDAVRSWGRYKGTHSFEEFKRRLTAKANALGFSSALPDEWKSDKKKALEGMLNVGAKALYDANTSDYVWCGVSHNAWQDDVEDIIPLALIEDDIAFQKRLIQKGFAAQFGEGLWVDHNPSPVIGDCQLREVVSGGRFCFEMGNLNPAYKGMDGKQMSISYKYGQKGGDYAWVYVFERSALDRKRRVNGRTFFSVKQRGLLEDATLGAVADEVTALLEELA